MKTYYKYCGSNEKFDSFQDAKQSIMVLTTDGREQIYNDNGGAVYIEKIVGDEVLLFTPVYFENDFSDVYFGTPQIKKSRELPTLYATYKGEIIELYDKVSPKWYITSIGAKMIGSKNIYPTKEDAEKELKNSIARKKAKEERERKMTEKYMRELDEVCNEFPELLDIPFLSLSAATTEELRDFALSLRASSKN